MNNDKSRYSHELSTPSARLNSGLVVTPTRLTFSLTAAATTPKIPKANNEAHRDFAIFSGAPKCKLSGEKERQMSNA